MNATIEEQVARYSRAMTATLERQEATSSPRPLPEYAAVTVPSRRRHSLWASAALFGLLVAVAAGAALIGGGWTSTDFAASPDADEAAVAATANDLLDDAVAMVEAGRSVDLCDQLSADPTLCQRIYDDLDPARVPTTPPHVIAGRTAASGGPKPDYVLTVCGIDGRGDPYVTGFEIVGVGDDHYLPVIPLYWSDMDVIDPADHGDGTAGATIDPADEAATDSAAQAAGCPS